MNKKVDEKNVEEIEKFWDKFTKERKLALGKLSTFDLQEKENNYREELEKKLSKRINRGYFDWHLILNEEINFYIVISDRNNGKSYSSRRIIEEYIKEGKRFLVMRSKKTELDGMVTSWIDWFNKNNWNYHKGEGRLSDSDNNTIGWFKSLSQSYTTKSNIFDEVHLVVYDEFITSKKEKQQFNKLIEVIIGVQRDRKNFKVMLMANFVDGENEIINNLGFSVMEQNTLQFNWLTNSLLWQVPPDTFEEFKDVDNVGYRASLNNKETFAANYGGQFTNTSPKNLQNTMFYGKNILEKIMIITEPHFEFLLCYDKSKNRYLIEPLVSGEITAYPEVPKFSTTWSWILRFSDVSYVKPESFSNLINVYYSDMVKVNGKVELRNKVNLFFDKIIKSMENQDFFYEVK